MPTYAIGDIQGCFEPFVRLLDEVGFHPDRDRVWLLGDLVNRGPQSLDVLRWCVAHKDNVEAVLGNHDVHLLALDYGVQSKGARDTRLATQRTTTKTTRCLEGTMKYRGARDTHSATTSARTTAKNTKC